MFVRPRHRKFSIIGFYYFTSQVYVSSYHFCNYQEIFAAKTNYSVLLIYSRGRATRFLIDCKSFLSVSLDVIRIFMSTVSFVTQLHSGIPCLLKCFHLNYDLTGFKSRDIFYTFYLQIFSKQLSCMILIFFFFFFL